MNSKYRYIRMLLLASMVIPVPATWCRMPFVLSRKHIEQVKQQLTYEDSRLAKLKAVALLAAAGGVGGVGYKWLKTPSEPQAQASQTQPGQAGQPPQPPTAPKTTGVKTWLLDQAFDIWQIGGRTVKGVIAYEIYLSVRDKINDLYTDRTLGWFMQRRTVLQTALDNFKQEVIDFDPQDKNSKDQLDNACRCLLAELESIIGFMQYTTERAQEQLRSHSQVLLPVSKVYLTRLGMSSEKVKAIAARFIEHVTLLLKYDQEYDQKRAMHNTMIGSLMGDLAKEMAVFKQFEQKVKTLNSGVAA